MATEYVLHRLTGKWGIDVSTATPFYFLDQRARAWNRDYPGALGIPEEKLPPLGGCGDLLGTVTEEGAAASGLPVGSRVFLGSFDHPTAARACRIEREGDLLISCGTSWVCFFPMRDRERIIERGFLCDPFLTPKGAWGAMCSLARASERIKGVLERYMCRDENKFAVLDELAASAPRGAEGMSFNPMKELPDLSAYEKKNIARALMEGIARALRERVGDAITVKHITMCGGPSTSPVWRAVLAETFGVPVEVTYGPHSGAVGAAMYALKD
jgi:sugar (pentulose or hexulose) kinase